MDEHLFVEEIRGEHIREDVNPVKSFEMLNFLHWLAVQHPEFQELRSIPEVDIRRLVDEFDGIKSDKGNSSEIH